jgi:flagellar biogenesis protein FliO
MTDGSVVMAVLRLVVSLAVVLVLLVLAARFAARRGAGGWRPGRATVEVEVLSRRALGRTSSLQVVQVGTQVMVLGVTERSVSVLGELDEADLVQPTPAAVSDAAPATPTGWPWSAAALVLGRGGSHRG